MRLYYPNNLFQLEEILSGKINQKNLSENELYVLNFINDWFSGNQRFNFKTSGSTGKPKQLVLTRSQLEYSANQTLNYFFPSNPPKHLLLGINPHFVGGTQQIVRAILAQADLTFREPSSSLLTDPYPNPFDLTAVFPIQLKRAIDANIDSIQTFGRILVGGASIAWDDEKIMGQRNWNNVFPVYGMTETASHVAVRQILEQEYQPLGDLQIRTDPRGCLELKGTITNNAWLLTNDLVEVSDTGFRLSGRIDEIINTGGFKVNPYEIEKRISGILDSPYMISWKADPDLGQKIVLVSSKSHLKEIVRSGILDKYEQPREEYILTNFPLTASGKIDRMAVNKMINE